MFNPFLWLGIILLYTAVYFAAGWQGIGTVIGFSACVVVVMFLREGANAKRG